MSGTILTTQLKPTDQIYRIISLTRFLKLFETSENVLVRPKLWDDTFENLALNSTTMVDGTSATFGFANDVYAQCWTRHKRSDAMWRIYSKGTDGIRIRTTVGKLLTSLASNFNADEARISCFLGSVKYLTDRSLVSLSKSHFANGLGTDGKLIASTLLVKRNAFEHENEVRLIYLSGESTPVNKDLFAYNMNPNELVEQVMLHPQMSKEDANRVKSKILAETGFAGELLQSMLYQPPKGFQFVIGGY